MYIIYVFIKYIFNFLKSFHYLPSSLYNNVLKGALNVRELDNLVTKVKDKSGIESWFSFFIIILRIKYNEIHEITENRLPVKRCRYLNYWLDYVEEKISKAYDKLGIGNHSARSLIFRY